MSLTVLPSFPLQPHSPLWCYACVAGDGPGGLPAAWPELCTHSSSLLVRHLLPERTGSKGGQKDTGVKRWWVYVQTATTTPTEKCSLFTSLLEFQCVITADISALFNTSHFITGWHFKKGTFLCRYKKQQTLTCFISNFLTRFRHRFMRI